MEKMTQSVCFALLVLLPIVWSGTTSPKPESTPFLDTTPKSFTIPSKTTQILEATPPFLTTSSKTVDQTTTTATVSPSAESVGFLVAVASSSLNSTPLEKPIPIVTGTISNAKISTWDVMENTSAAENFTPSLVFAPASNSILRTEPRIVEITTHVTEPGSGTLSGPHIDGIEAHLEEPHSVETTAGLRRIPSAVEEKLEALSCDVPPLPSQSILWNGNQTRDLALPVTVPLDCEQDEMDCSDEMSLSWEISAEVQTGDVLLIRIDDHTLIQSSLAENFTRFHQPSTAVYQVSRSGHENCDVSDGTLLDITPLVVDGQKLLTLYDKDLTEGINLLIVVSELWGQQCVRLRVSVKSDNCGENADCSNKGVCFSNASMRHDHCSSVISQMAPCESYQVKVKALQLAILVDEEFSWRGKIRIKAFYAKIKSHFSQA